MKRCPSCGEVKPLEGFYRLARSKDGRQGYCKPCANAKRIAWGKANPERHKEWNRNSYMREPPGQRAERKLYSQFRLSLDDYHQMLADQGGGCAACGAPPPATRRLQVDHDHSCCDTRYTCGLCVRGLLCLNCNATLGHVRDSPDRLLRLVAYLERTGKGC